MALPNKTTLEGNIRYLQNGEVANQSNLNRPLRDLVDQLADSGGIFDSIEELATYGTVHKATHVTNDTGMVCHFDSGPNDVINKLQPTKSGNVVPFSDANTSKFFGSQNMYGSAPTQGAGTFYEYTSVPESSGISEGTISFWVYPQSNNDIWNYAGGDNIALVMSHDDLTEQVAGTHVTSTDTANYFEIGFDDNDKYFYAKMAGSASGTVILKEADNSHPDSDEFNEKWYQLTFTWMMDAATAIHSLNFYVNGDLVATNPSPGDPARLAEDFNFVQKIQIQTGGYNIDELRYDARQVTDEEVLMWYESDVPFIHNIDGLIDPAQFGNNDVNQFLKILASGSTSGDYTKTYSYNGEGYLSSVTFTNGGDWEATATYAYVSGGATDGFLSSITFQFQISGLYTNPIRVVESYSYNGTTLNLETATTTTTII